MKLPTLYKRNARNNLQEWTIVTEGNSYYVREGIVGGNITQTNPHTCEGKNIGRANETTPEAQAEREAQAEWDKKLKRGYAQDKDAVDSVAFRKPMKGDKWKDRADEVTWPVWVQDKLNGIRCQNDKDRAFSTGGETFHTIPHIRQALQKIYDAYPGAFIDGEAFNYALRKRLNRLTSIVSVVHKLSDCTPELLAESKQIVQLHVFDGYGFDGITPNLPWITRYEATKSLLEQLDSPYVRILPVEQAMDINDMMRRLVANRKRGGEGLMIRWGECPFKIGRSKYMLKLKHFEDAEFKVVDVQEGNGDWKGCAKRIIIEVPSATVPEKQCASNIEGDREWLRKLYQEKEKVIGKMATVEFQCLSEYGIPQLPWIRSVRDYEGKIS